MTTKILCDADFLIALFTKQDSTHQKALDLYNSHDSDCFTVMNLTIYEVATVLSRKMQQDKAIYTLESIRIIFPNAITFDIAWEAEVIDLYNSFTKKNISFFDCACMILAPKINAKIASFDSFYPPEILA
jgi:predicted nucleic acid-binding protein